MIGLLFFFILVILRCFLSKLPSQVLEKPSLTTIALLSLGLGLGFWSVLSLVVGGIQGFSGAAGVIQSLAYLFSIITSFGGDVGFALLEGFFVFAGMDVSKQFRRDLASSSCRSITEKIDWTGVTNELHKRVIEDLFNESDLIETSFFNIHEMELDRSNIVKIRFEEIKKGGNKTLYCVYFELPKNVKAKREKQKPVIEEKKILIKLATIITQTDVDDSRLIKHLDELGDRIPRYGGYRRWSKREKEFVTGIITQEYLEPPHWKTIKEWQRHWYEYWEESRFLEEAKKVLTGEVEQICRVTTKTYFQIWKDSRLASTQATGNDFMILRDEFGRYWCKWVDYDELREKVDFKDMFKGLQYYLPSATSYIFGAFEAVEEKCPEKFGGIIEEVKKGEKIFSYDDYLQAKLVEFTNLRDKKLLQSGYLSKTFIEKIKDTLLKKGLHQEADEFSQIISDVRAFIEYDPKRNVYRLIHYDKLKCLIELISLAGYKLSYNFIKGFIWEEILHDFFYKYTYRLLPGNRATNLVYVNLIDNSEFGKKFSKEYGLKLPTDWKDGNIVLFTQELYAKFWLSRLLPRLDEQVFGFSVFKGFEENIASALEGSMIFCGLENSEDFLQGFLSLLTEEERKASEIGHNYRSEHHKEPVKVRGMIRQAVGRKEIIRPVWTIVTWRKSKKLFEELNSGFPLIFTPKVDGSLEYREVSIDELKEFESIEKIDVSVILDIPEKEKSIVENFYDLKDKTRRALEWLDSQKYRNVIFYNFSKIFPYEEIEVAFIILKTFKGLVKEDSLRHIHRIIIVFPY